MNGTLWVVDYVELLALNPLFPSFWRDLPQDKLTVRLCQEKQKTGDRWLIGGVRLTAHAVSHEGLTNNHEFCNLSFGHGLEPKIFWVPFNGTGIAEERRSRFPVDLKPDG